MVWRVYPDGRPDELVRGVDIVGTPLLSLNTIMLTGDTLQVFNGICGAESGQIPVAAAAPAMLFSEIEVQKRAKGTQRPPVLPPPGFENAAPPTAGEQAMSLAFAAAAYHVYCLPTLCGQTAGAFAFFFVGARHAVPGKITWRGSGH